MVNLSSIGGCGVIIQHYSPHVALLWSIYHHLGALTTIFDQHCPHSRKLFYHNTNYTHYRFQHAVIKMFRSPNNISMTKQNFVLYFYLIYWLHVFYLPLIDSLFSANLNQAIFKHLFVGYFFFWLSLRSLRFLLFSHLIALFVFQYYNYMMFT